MEYFESIACEEFDVLNIAYHEKRIMNTISKNFSLSEIIYAPTNECLKCKVIYNDDEIISVEYDVYKKREIKTKFNKVYLSIPTPVHKQTVWKYHYKTQTDCLSSR